MTHTDSAAREAIRALCGALENTPGVHWPPSMSSLVCDHFISPPQPEAKPEGLKWKGGITPSPVKGGFGLCYFPNFMGRKWWCVDLRWRSIHEMVRDGHHLAAWPTEEAATSALNACTQPPPDFVEPAKPEAVNTAVSASDIHGDEPEDCNPFGLSGSNTAVHVSMPAKPEAGEQRVKDLTGEVRRLRSALASVEGYQHTERTDAEKITQIKAIASDALNLDPVGICTPQPAEPKVMPQPSEQAKGASR